jgi:hypothetical protein
MRYRLTPLRVRLALVAIVAGLPAIAFVHGRPREKPAAAAKGPQAWTLDEALDQLSLCPYDPYLQYVALQLARREGRKKEVGDRLRWQASDVRGVNRSVDLFELFGGALAVQESLQLDVMIGGTALNPRAERGRRLVPIASLSGPTVKSHPWTKLLGDKKPALSPLASNVPDDFYFVGFRSLAKLHEVAVAGDLWGGQLLGQVSHDARSQRASERLLRQLVLDVGPIVRKVADNLVEEVAVTGSDLMVAEGSDVTLLFRLKNSGAFKTWADGSLADMAKARPDARRSEGKYQGIPYVHLTTPERDVHVFSAYPEKDLHVRSNSLVALERVLAAVKGTTARGEKVRRLGDTAEFAYIRTLMPRGAPEEDGFIYLSDPFIRNLVGPQLRLADRRRKLCYNHLRMIGHAATMYRTERGAAARSLDDLHAARCCPGAVQQGRVVLPRRRYLPPVSRRHPRCLLPARPRPADGALLREPAGTGHRGGGEGVQGVSRPL